uniref:F-box domain-containing protein n=1 Tax=Tetranychus urticae TaxID=32264 RepID=T1K8U2_TETUR
MLINELPDDCLLTIFDYLNNLEDLANCYKVCIKWSHLIAERTRKVKYLMENPDYSSDSVYYQGLDLSTRRETLLNTLFPNLIGVGDLENNAEDLANEAKDLEKILQCFRDLKSLKGIINCCDLSIEKYCDNLEMLSVSNFKPDILQNGYNIKQLHPWYYYPDFETVLHHFPNLERLHIRTIDSQYKGPVLEKLKILELEVLSVDICYAFQLINSCPNLQSAHLYVDNDRFFVDETLKHECLQDLVIDYHGGSCRDCNDLIRALIRYPNLKHLSLRNIRFIKNPSIEKLVHILPNLVLFDVSRCKKVTQKAADYVQDYCKRYGRSLKFYFKGNRDELASDWPQLSTKREIISRNFDFMKHCFRKRFDDLPCFLVPI